MFDISRFCRPPESRVLISKLWSRLCHAASLTFLLTGCDDFVCKALGECPDLLEMTMTETAEDFFDEAYFELVGETNSEFSLGALALSVQQDGYFRFGNVDLHRQSSFGDAKYHNPKINFLVYSEPIMSSVATGVRPNLRDSSQTGLNTGHLRDMIIFSHNTNADLRANGASPQFIGLVISQIGPDLLLEMVGEIVDELGGGIASSDLTDVQYWHSGGRYIATSTAHDVIFIYSEQQAWQNCLYLGDLGVLDLGGCDIEAFNAAAPYSYRTVPQS